MPQEDTNPTFPTFEQLISWGDPSAFGELQLLSKSGCPVTGQAKATGQSAVCAFSWMLCCCLTKRTPAVTPNTKNRTIPIVITRVRVPDLPDFLLVTVSKGETAGLGSGIFIHYIARSNCLTTPLLLLG